MREIEFRGKTLQGDWVYGDLVRCYDSYIQTGKKDSLDRTQFTKVIEETVGQYAGLKDKNGQGVYEGDVFRIDKDTYLVTFDGLAFDWQKIYDSWLKKSVFKKKVKSWLSRTDAPLFYEIIGNIHDNPELLEVL